MKIASDKFYTPKINRHFFGTKYGTFSQCDLTTSRLEISERGKVYKNIAFFFKKGIKFVLIRNITHQMKSLRESFIPQKRTIEASNNPGYEIRLKQNDNYRQNLHEKLCTKTVSPLSVKYSGDH